MHETAATVSKIFGTWEMHWLIGPDHSFTFVHHRKTLHTVSPCLVQLPSRNCEMQAEVGHNSPGTWWENKAATRKACATARGIGHSAMRMRAQPATQGKEA